MINIYHVFKTLPQRVVGNGAKTLFWEGKWLGDKSLADIFLRFYNLTFSKLVTIDFVMRNCLDVLEFRRILHGETADRWEDLGKMVDEKELRDCQDRVDWPLTNLL